MNQITIVIIDALKLLLTLLPLVGLIWSIVTIKKKDKIKKGLCQLICSVVLATISYCFLKSHNTWIEYNDYWILNNNIEKVQSRYGDFEYEKNGEKGYHVFYNNGPVMPDYLNYYYIMEYDEAGNIYKVYLSAIDA